MFFVYINKVFGFLKMLIYKLFFIRRLSFSFLSGFDSSIRITLKKKSRIILGKRFRNRKNCSFRTEKGAKIIIGNNCFFNENCIVVAAQSIVIGDNVSFGPNVVIIDHDHDYKNNFDKLITSKIAIGNNCWIGSNVTILKGVSIGDNVVIGAGTLVNKSIKSNSLVFDKKEKSILSIND